MQLPGYRDYIFALKTFGAAMLAVFVAFSLDLERPSWAMVTVMITAQPLAGMVRSKAMYRVCGTLIGGVFATFAVTLFVTSPELMTLVMALWIGVAVFASVLDRTPRAYAFMLAGYTAAIIAFPSVGAPEAVFETALSRCEEIILGILCMVVVDYLVLPRRTGPVFAARLEGALASAFGWTADTLTNALPADRADAARRGVVAEATALDALRIHANYDTPSLRAASRAIGRLQRRMQILFSVVVAVEDRMTSLRDRRPELLERLDPLLSAVAERVRKPAADVDDAAGASELTEAIRSQAPDDQAIRRDPDVLLLRIVYDRMADVVRLWQECGVLHRRIVGGGLDEAAVPDTDDYHVDVHRDPAVAALSGVAAALAVLLVSVFWIASAWPDGAGAVVIAAVGCSIFSAVDDPAPMILSFLKGSLIATLLAGVYLFGILPHIDGFPMLVLVLAPLLVPMIAFMAIPAYLGIMLPATMITAVLIGVQNTMTYDFAGYVNAAIGQNAGIAAAVVLTRLCRSIDADRVVGRLSASVRRELRRLAAWDGVAERSGFEARMFSRVHELGVRVGSLDDTKGRPIAAALAGLRIGLNIIRLQRARIALPPGERRAADLALARIARQFKQARGPLRYARLGAVLDRGIARISHDPSPAATEALLALAGIRHALAAHPAVAMPEPAAGRTPEEAAP
ncbi:FUSC family protein [Marinivivus vitaminiproducens]|uniref:FUSC family protein n=1 Tax=Marinivivus vitaminiproducens TaxID=3035935 RepID=UPI00279836AD|nr:FUSC family protein [Geminicoccaceae bacterium SCSIO 64248]